MFRCTDIIYMIHNARYIHHDRFLCFYCSYWTVKASVCSFSEISVYFRWQTFDFIKRKCQGKHRSQILSVMLERKMKLSRTWLEGTDEIEALLHSLSTLTLCGAEWSVPRSGRFVPKNERRRTLNWRLGGPQSCSEFWKHPSTESRNRSIHHAAQSLVVGFLCI